MGDVKPYSLTPALGLREYIHAGLHYETTTDVALYVRPCCISTVSYDAQRTCRTCTYRYGCSYEHRTS